MLSGRESGSHRLSPHGRPKISRLPKAGNVAKTWPPWLSEIAEGWQHCQGLWVGQKWYCGKVAKLAAITVFHDSSYATDATMHEGAKWPSRLHCRLARSQRRVLNLAKSAHRLSQRCIHET